MPIKKSKLIAAKPAQKSVGIFTWLFSPTQNINLPKYILHIGLFVIGFIASISLLMALSIKLQLAGQGIPVELAGFLERFFKFSDMLYIVLMSNPIAFILFFIFLIIIGGFIFMPRAKLSRYGFLATHWTSLFWTVISIGAIITMILTGNIFSAWLISILGAITALGIICLVITSARFASSLKVSNWAIALSFPFGFILYSLTGYFLPNTDKADTDISVDYKWYHKLINFLSVTKYGIAVLIILQILTLLLFSMPSADIIAIVFAILAVTIGAKRILKNIKTLSWVAVVVNILMITGIIMVIEMFPVQLIKMAMS